VFLSVLSKQTHFQGVCLAGQHTFRECVWLDNTLTKGVCFAFLLLAIFDSDLSKRGG